MKPLTNRQKDIVNASISIIAKKGIQKLTIKNISQKLGISEPAIYRHFDSKLDILLAILMDFSNNSKQAFIAVLDTDIPAIKQFEALYTHHFVKFANNPALTAVIFSEEIFQSEKVLANKVLEVMNRNLELLANIIEKGQKQGEIRTDIDKRHLANIIMGSLRLLITKWRLSKYAFFLEEEGALVLESLKKLLCV